MNSISVAVKSCATAVAMTAFCVPHVNAQETGENTGTNLFPKGLTASFSIAEQYDDNIFSTRNNKVSDWVTIFKPSLEYAHDTENVDFRVGGNAEIGRYAGTSSENYEDYRIYGNGTVILAPNVRMVSGVSHARDHEERSSPDDVNGTVPTVYNLTSGYSAVQVRSGRNSLKVGGTLDHYDFDDSGVINNDDRDRWMASAGARFDHRITDSTRLFVDSSWDGRNYRSMLDDNGFNRSSNGARASVGVFHRFNPNLYGEVYGGWIYQNYDDPLLRDVSTVDFGGRLGWEPDNVSRLSLSLERSVEETTLAGASSYVRTEAAAGYHRYVDERTIVDLNLAYANNDYQGTSQTDHVLTLSAEGQYYVTPHAFLGLSYTYENRDSSVIANNYDRSIIMARLGADLQPAYGEGSRNGPLTDYERQTYPYVGIKAGLAGPGTDLAGPRGNGGTLQADFADLGAAGAFFAGIGTTVNRWYAGIEADVGLSGAGWDHARLPGGRVFAVDQDLSYGASALFGRMFDNGGMVFGRAGIKVTEFDTSYITASGASFRQTNREPGMRFGAGLQAKVSENLAVRMEYEHTAYDDYNVVVPSGTDNFANTESLMSMGLVYTFGGSGGSDEDTANGAIADFSGFYAGAQAGHGSFVSRTTGPRTASTLTADFGDVGLTGTVLAGYSAQYGRFVFGAEADAAISNAGWRHVRDPTGRTYSVTKDYSLGVSGRAGVVIGNSSLLFAKAGVVQSSLNHRFARGAQNINSSKWTTGLRVGLGMEVPVTDAMTVRADLTFTDYETSSLFVPGATNGTETYRSSESLFSLGTIFRF